VGGDGGIRFFNHADAIVGEKLAAVLPLVVVHLLQRRLSPCETGPINPLTLAVEDSSL